VQNLRILPQAKPPDPLILPIRGHPLQNTDVQNLRILPQAKPPDPLILPILFFPRGSVMGVSLPCS